MHSYCTTSDFILYLTFRTHATTCYTKGIFYKLLNCTRDTQFRQIYNAAPEQVKEYISMVKDENQFPLYAEVCLRQRTATAIMEGTCLNFLG